MNTYNYRTTQDQILNDTTPLLRGQTCIVLRYSLISSTTLSDRVSAHLVLRYSLISASTHLVLRYSLISATGVSVSASILLFCAMAPQYCTVPSGTYCAMSYSFLITGLGSQIVI